MDVQGQRYSLLGEQHEGREGNGWPGRRRYLRAAGSLEGGLRGMGTRSHMEDVLSQVPRALPCPQSPTHRDAARARE